VRQAEGAAIEVDDAGLEAGQQVEVSVSGRMLGLAAAAVFGPALIWTLALSALADGLAPGSLAGLGLSGYALALWLGSILARRAGAGLDVRVAAGRPRKPGNLYRVVE
jgi:hypothetical protein